MNLDNTDIEIIADFLSVFIDIEKNIRDSGDPDGILEENGWIRGDL